MCTSCTRYLQCKKHDHTLNFCPHAVTMPISEHCLHYDFNYTTVKFSDCICHGYDAIVLTEPAHRQADK